ncbi:MAG TPA: hypothetical protein VMF09_12755 [Solirubrobacteraceae bacterium]|nr:hypothetical protein [Solirubrobacteraceae bacterium]
MPKTSRIRRLARPLPIALTLAVLTAALLGPAETLAQTHRTTCPSAGAHTRDKRARRACAPSSHKPKTHHAVKRDAGKGRSKARPARKSGRSRTSGFTPARCEDGSVPALAADGSFSCEEGSEPHCEDGATPTRATGGKTLVCAPASEPQAPAGAETECEELEEGEAEEASACPAGASSGSGSGSGEQSCQASDCEAEA